MYDLILRSDIFICLIMPPSTGNNFICAYLEGTYRNRCNLANVNYSYDHPN